MRILVACPECKRRYDASRHPPGSRFRCRCGKVLTVSSPQGHDADVVRCSSCGAAREDGRQTCSFCGADFTLHERDLDTVCPECMSRVSSKAKFCHHCGTPLFATETVGDQTSLLCPACVDHTPLHSRTLGNNELSALECDRCAGLWLSNDVFEYLARKAQGNEVSAVERREPRTPSRTASPQCSRYRPCPFCRKLMNRTDYGIRSGGRASGTIIDVCRQHGIWFDADELTRILDWLGRGGKLQSLGRSPEPVPRASQRPAESPAPVSLRRPTDSEDPIAELAYHVGRLLGTLFHV